MHVLNKPYLFVSLELVKETDLLLALPLPNFENEDAHTQNYLSTLR